MRNLLNVLCLLQALFVFDIALAAQVGTASFHAEATPGFLSIDAKGAPVEGQPKVDGGKLSGEFKVKLSNFKTDSDLRDKHMCEYLKCDKHPYAVFKMDPVAPASGSFKVSGIMSLAGVDKKLSGDATFEGKVLKVKGKLNLADFGVSTPSYKLLSVGNDISLDVAVTFP